MNIKNITMKEKSSLHLAIISNTYEFNNEKEKRINFVFEDLFPGENKLVSYVRETGEESEVELIYEIQKPLLDELNLTKEFYENLEVLFEELKEFNPHFTQYRRVD